MRNRQVVPSQRFGHRAIRLFTELHEKGRTTFTVHDVRDILGLESKSTRNFVEKLVHRELATRLRRGLFAISPFELVPEREFLGNPYVVARELAGGGDYYLSHASAMHLHRMLTEPQLVAHVTRPRGCHARSRSIIGTQFRFVRCKQEHFFGFVEHALDDGEKVLVSDLERTILDGLKQPEYCGGIVGVARAYRMRRSDMDVGRLVDYALRLDVGAVIGRLGFLLETCGVDEPAKLGRLRARPKTGYHVLDPALPRAGRRMARWRLCLNVNLQELESARSTRPMSAETFSACR